MGSVDATHCLGYLKCQPFLLRAELDLEEVEPATVRVVWRTYRPPPPTNLRVFGDRNAPTYSTGEDLVVDWDAATDARSLTPAHQDLSAQAERTVLVITSPAGVELAEIAVPGAVGPHTIANAEPIAASGTRSGVRTGGRVSGNRDARKGDRTNKILPILSKGHPVKPALPWTSTATRTRP
jgi:hypothetical protein